VLCQTGQQPVNRRNPRSARRCRTHGVIAPGGMTRRSRDALRLRAQASSDERSGLGRDARYLERNYKPWQRGLVQLALLYWPERSQREDVETVRRAADKLKRERLAARRTRAGLPSGTRPNLGGRRKSYDAAILYAAVQAHREHGVTYRDIAAFLVNKVAPKLPADLRARLAPSHSADDVVRLELRIRRAASPR
jgi:hypothetical protein